MWNENCRRTMKGYDPHDPTTIGEQIFYMLFALRYELKIVAMGIWRQVSRELGG